jgi:hypothetical protein
MNAEDLNSQPDQSPSRWVINFFDWPLSRKMAPSDYDGPVAADYPDCLGIVEEKVKPEREKNNRKVYRERWWHHGEKRPELYATIAGMKHVVVCPIVTKHLSFVFASTSMVYAHRLCVFALDRADVLAVLSSNFHEPWARKYSSTLETRLNYSPADCFENFPLPEGLARLGVIGKTYHEHRTAICLAHHEGLTTTYNRFHNPEETDSDIRKLRELHVEMDKAVAAAYGWSDLDLGHGFHETKQDLRFTISEAARREVLGRLLKLNHERYAEEVAKGLHDKKGKGKGSGSGKGRRATKTQPAGKTLFGGEESEDDDPGGEATTEAGAQAEKEGQQENRRHGQSTAQADGRPPSIDEIDTDEIMAAFRQSARGQGWKGRDDLLKDVSLTLGYQRLGLRIEEALRGHLRAAIRRRIIESDGDLVRLGIATMEQYDLEDLRATLCSVMRAGRRYEREEVIHAVARYLGFARVTETVRQSMKSAINSGIRQGILAYEGEVIWRES